MNSETVNTSQDIENSNSTESTSQNINNSHDGAGSVGKTVQNMMGMSALKDAMRMGLFNKPKKSKNGITKPHLSTKAKINRRRNKAAHKSRMKNYKLAKMKTGKKVFKSV